MYDLDMVNYIKILSYTISDPELKHKIVNLLRGPMRTCVQPNNLLVNSCFEPKKEKITFIFSLDFKYICCGDVGEITEWKYSEIAWY